MAYVPCSSWGDGGGLCDEQSAISGSLGVVGGHGGVGDAVQCSASAHGSHYHPAPSQVSHNNPRYLNYITPSISPVGKLNPPHLVRGEERCLWCSIRRRFGHCYPYRPTSLHFLSAQNSLLLFLPLLLCVYILITPNINFSFVFYPCP